METLLHADGGTLIGLGSLIGALVSALIALWSALHSARKDELARLQQRNEQLETRLAETTDAHLARQAELAAQYADLLEKWKTTQRALASAQEQIQKLRADVEALYDENSALRREYARLVNENSQLRARIAELEQRLADSLRERDSLQARVVELEREVVELRGKT